jgi:HJR/Mrr/RecB family endonuclease
MGGADMHHNERRKLVYTAYGIAKTKPSDTDGFVNRVRRYGHGLPGLKQISDRIQKTRDAKQAEKAERLASRKLQREAQAVAKKKREIQLGRQQWNDLLATTDNRLAQANAGRCTGQELLTLLSWEQLEDTVSKLLGRHGWHTELTKGGADKGVDIKGVRRTSDGGHETLVVQVKHWKRTQVGAPAIRELVGVKVLEKASHAIFATSSKFVSGAEKDFAGIVELWDGTSISRQIDNMSDAAFEDFVTPYQQAVGEQAIADAERLEREKERLEKGRELEDSDELVRTKQEQVLEELREMKRSPPSCPKCGAETRVLLGKTYFWGCTRYRSHGCRGTVNVPVEDPRDWKSPQDAPPPKV